jgi:hypothetical protein
MKQPVAILITSICLAFFFASLIYAATIADVERTIAEEKAQVQAALAHQVTTELRCDTQYWAHDMIDQRYENGVWIYTCRVPWGGTGVLATNVYYHQ